jgi:hypothetical protein
MTDEESLLDAIEAAQEDCERHIQLMLEYADWLDENLRAGDDRRDRIDVIREKFAESRRWIEKTKFWDDGDNWGGWDWTYREFVVDALEVGLGASTTSICDIDVDEYWKHWEVCTGLKRDGREVYFSCSC